MRRLTTTDDESRQRWGGEEEKEKYKIEQQERIKVVISNDWSLFYNIATIKSYLSRATPHCIVLYTNDDSRDDRRYQFHEEEEKKRDCNKSSLHINESFLCLLWQIHIKKRVKLVRSKDGTERTGAREHEIKKMKTINYELKSIEREKNSRNHVINL